MSEYLLNIAARNTGTNSNELLPSVPQFNTSDTGINEDFIEKDVIQFNGIQNQSFQQGIVSAQPLTPQKAPLDAVLNETEKSFTQKNTENSYFSKHIERLADEKENSPLKNKTAETINFKIDQGTSSNTVANTSDEQNEHEQIFTNKTVLKILPEKKEAKKQTSNKINKKPEGISLNESVNADKIIYSEKQIIQPADKKDEAQNNKINDSNNLRPERITPNQPEQLSKIPVQNNKINEATPKLVIGKITVEIMPPKLPVPQKIITKVVQTPSKESYSKSSKLSFGLRQL
jgi:hypothetical protein